MTSPLPADPTSTDDRHPALAFIISATSDPTESTTDDPTGTVNYLPALRFIVPRNEPAPASQNPGGNGVLPGAATAAHLPSSPSHAGSRRPAHAGASLRASAGKPTPSPGTAPRAASTLAYTGNKPVIALTGLGSLILARVLRRERRDDRVAAPAGPLGGPTGDRRVSSAHTRA